MIDATVLIVGCGPTGIAHELLRRGISCRLVDKRPDPQSSTRAFTVHARTWKCLTIWAWREAYRCNGEGKMSRLVRGLRQFLGRRRRTIGTVATALADIAPGVEG